MTTDSTATLESAIGSLKLCVADLENTARRSDEIVKALYNPRNIESGNVPIFKEPIDGSPMVETFADMFQGISDRIDFLRNHIDGNLSKITHLIQEQ